MSAKRLNREATIQNIVEVAKDSIKDIEELKRADDEFLIEAAMLWDVNVVYE
jgi:hypothetical protein